MQKRERKIENLVKLEKMGEKIRERMKNIDGSKEPLSEYKSDVIKEIDVEDLHYMQDNRQNTTRN